MMNRWLVDRIRLGTRYEVPVNSGVTDESEDALREVNGLGINLITAQQGEKMFIKYEQFNLDHKDEEHVISKEVSKKVNANYNGQHQIMFEKNLYSLNIDIIREPFHQPKTIAKPKKVVNGKVNKVNPLVCSGIDLAFSMNEETKVMDVTLQANNERNVFCVENFGCPGMLVDLEVSCSSLRQNIRINNMGVASGEKIMREFIGFVNPETNSCFKYYIRPGVIHQG